MSNWILLHALGDRRLAEEAVQDLSRLGSSARNSTRSPDPSETTVSDANRADLHDALAKAAVVEQQLALQYLYAAASLQWIPPVDLAPDDPSQVTYEDARGAAMTLLLLARQEMEHQSWVLNLMVDPSA